MPAVKPSDTQSASGKRGRNDPCPSGAGVKIKKCLSAHPELTVHSSPGAVWWLCDRWQAPQPSDSDLLEALSELRTIAKDKLAALEERLFAAPSDSVPWEWVWPRFASAGHDDPSALLRRIVERAGPGDPACLGRVCSAAIRFARDSRPELLGVVVEVCGQTDEKHIDPGVVGELAEALEDHGLTEQLQALRTRFPRWVPERQPRPVARSAAAPSDKAELPFPIDEEPRSPEEERADKLWADFLDLPAATVTQMDTLVDELLALPGDLTEWNDVLHVLASRKHPDVFGVYRRIIAVVDPGLRGLGFLHWAAAEIAGERRLPEIASHFARLDRTSYDVDALIHLLEMLMFHGFARESLDLGVRFLPVVAKDPEVISSTAHELAARVLELRLALRMVSTQPVPDPPESVVEGLEKWIDSDFGVQAVRALDEAAIEPEWSPDRFFGLAHDSASEELRRETAALFLDTRIRVVREAFLIDGLAPSITWLGWSGIWRMLTIRTDERRTPSRNVLDHLVSKRIEPGVARACAGMFGTDVIRADAMIRTLGAVTRFATRRGLLPADKARSAESRLDQLRKKIEPA